MSADVAAAYERELEAAVQALEALRALDGSTQFVIPSGLPERYGPALMLGPTAADLAPGRADLPQMGGIHAYEGTSGDRALAGFLPPIQKGP